MNFNPIHHHCYRAAFPWRFSLVINFLCKIYSYLKIALIVHSSVITYASLWFDNLLIFTLIYHRIYYEYPLSSSRFRDLIFRYLILSCRFQFLVSFSIILASFFLRNVWFWFFWFNPDVFDEYWWFLDDWPVLDRTNSADRSSWWNHWAADVFVIYHDTT